MILHFLYYVNEPDWIRRAGVLVALAGTAAAAPEGTVRLWRAMADLFRRGLSNLRAVMAHVLPFLRQNASVTPSSVHGSASVSAGFGVAASGRVWIKHGSLEAHVEYLDKQLQRAFDDIERVRRETKDAHATLMQTFEERITELRADYQDLRDSLRERRNWEASVDSRGIFVIALGVFLWGIPDELALVPVVGWIFSVCCPDRYRDCCSQDICRSSMTSATADVMRSRSSATTFRS
jgi:hypothetical protein